MMMVQEKRMLIFHQCAWPTYNSFASNVKKAKKKRRRSKVTIGIWLLELAHSREVRVALFNDCANRAQHEKKTEAASQQNSPSSRDNERYFTFELELINNEIRNEQRAHNSFMCERYRREEKFNFGCDTLTLRLPCSASINFQLRQGDDGVSTRRWAFFGYSSFAFLEGEGVKVEAEKRAHEKSKTHKHEIYFLCSVISWHFYPPPPALSTEEIKKVCSWLLLLDWSL